MKEEILQRIDALAAKLGTTVEYLWPLCVQQARLKAIVGFVGALGFTFLFLWTARLIWKCREGIANEMDPAVPPVLMGILFILAGCVFFLCGGRELITMLIPEPDALRGLIGDIK